MQKPVAWIIFIVVLCLILLYGAYRAFRHEEARPAVSPTAAFAPDARNQSCPPASSPMSSAPLWMECEALRTTVSDSDDSSLLSRAA